MREYQRILNKVNKGGGMASDVLHPSEYLYLMEYYLKHKPNIGISGMDTPENIKSRLRMYQSEINRIKNEM